MSAPSVPSVLWRARSATVGAVQKPLLGCGQWMLFIGQTFWYLPLTVRRYTRQTLATMIEMSWGRGALIVDGGTISVLLILGMAVGASLGIEALATLNTLGFGALSGLIGGVGAVRVIGPLIAGIAFTAQAGTRMTAEIGAMRISEEIDALETMGLRPIPFVVGTRLVGGLMCVVPGYLLTLVATFFVVFFAAGAGVESAAALMAVTGFFSATVTMMCASLRWYRKARPIGAGRMRFMRGPSLAMACLT